MIRSPKAVLSLPRPVIVLMAIMVTFLASTIVISMTGCHRPQNQVPISPPAPVNTTGGAGDAGGGSNDRPAYDDIKSVLKTLSETPYEWAYVPLSVFEYEDLNGIDHKDMSYTKNVTQAMRPLLNTIRKDILERNARVDGLTFNFKDQGGCEGQDGLQEASAQMCNRKSSICISLEYIQKMTPKASLKPTLIALVMHEIAHQNCADENGAKQVERFYSDEAVQNYSLLETIGSSFEVIRQNLQTLTEFLHDGYKVCEEGKKLVITNTEMCSTIGATSSMADSLIEQIHSTSFNDPNQDPAQNFRELIRTINSYCENGNLNALAKDGTHLNQMHRQTVSEARNAFDKWAQSFTERSGYNVLDFSKFLFPKHKFIMTCPSQ